MKSWLMKDFENYKALCNIITNVHCEFALCPIILFIPPNITLRLFCNLILQEKKLSLNEVRWYAHDQIASK